MKILTFQAERFAWRPHARSLPDASDATTAIAGEASPAQSVTDAPPPTLSAAGATVPAQSVTDAVVAFVHAEPKDQAPEARDRALRHAAKHIQWLANKRDLKNVVLHSFTHLAPDTAEAGFAELLLSDLGAKLAKKGYAVSTTPFGYTCAWELSVFGESLAKVWKEI